MSEELIASLAMIGLGVIAVVGLFFIWYVIIKAILRIGGCRGD